MDKLDERDVRVFMNGAFISQPHPYFYSNCVKEHLKANHPHMPYQAKEQWKTVYYEMLKKGQVVKVNNMAFKAKIKGDKR